VLGLGPFEWKLLLETLFLSNLSKKLFKSVATAGFWLLAIALKLYIPSFS